MVDIDNLRTVTIDRIVEEIEYLLDNDHFLEGVHDAAEIDETPETLRIVKGLIRDAAESVSGL